MIQLSENKRRRIITHGYFFFALLYLLLLKHITFPLNTLLKPIPIFILLFAIRHINICEKRWSALLWALVFSLAGDIALTFDGQESFLIGLTFFAIAHLCYISFFFHKIALQKSNGLLIASLCIIATIVLTKLLPETGTLKLPVAIYATVLMMMVTVAQLNQSLSILTKAGCILFLLSDGLLSIQLFMHVPINLEPMIMSSYYLAQFFIVRGLLERKRLDTPLSWSMTEE